MKQWIIQKLFLNSSLGRSAFIAGAILWGALLLPAAYIILNVQLSNLNQTEIETRNSIQELLVNTFTTSGRFGDLVNARGMVLKLGKTFGLTDVGVCKEGVDIIPRAFENRCIDIPTENSRSIENGITLRFYWSDTKVNWSAIVIKAILISLFFSFLMFLLTSIVYYRIFKKRIHLLSERIINENAEESNPLESFSVPEMQPVVQALRDYRAKINQYHLEKQKLESEAVFSSIAKQVSHDIRSPLSALTMVASTLTEISEDKRVLIRNATQRINDIANDLFQKAKNTNTLANLRQTANKNVGSNESLLKSEKTKLSADFIPAVVDVLISEKRMQYREHAGLEIEVDLKNSFGAFAKINNNDLKRIISNLVNNAVEAFNDFQGKITVGVRKVDINHTSVVEIFVKDNGKGIPAHLIEKLGQAGISFGKSSSHQSGSGLGLHHAKKTAASFGGNLTIESQEGIGTTVRIVLPLAEAPKWFANLVDLTDKKYLVSLDDDISIHQIWSGRLQGLGFNELEHIRFQSSEAFEQYVNSNINKLRQTLYLVDYELLNQSKTGLDVIEDLGIEKYSILVTSRYEEASIQDRALQLKLPLLPKALAGFVPMIMNPTKEKM
ncbi:MAG: sensor histidine kinase [Bdellovibrio sp.]